MPTIGLILSAITVTQPITPMDTQTSQFLEEFAKVFSSLDNLPLSEQRATIKEMFRIPESQLEQVASFENIVVNGTNGDIPVRIFSPSSNGPLPIIVFFHRGGWVYGSVDESERICRKLANEIGAIVASVEYKLSPEHKFPIPLEDCYDATKWLVQNAATFSGNAAQVILCGESAGGNLAAAVALKARDTKEFSVARQLLLYPVLTMELDEQRYENSPDKSLLTYDNMTFFIDSYLSSGADLENPYAAPIKSHDLTRLPACFVVTAEFDALKHEGQEYAEVLGKFGVDTLYKCYPGVIHGFLDLPLADEVKQDAMADIVAWVKSL